MTGQRRLGDDRRDPRRELDDEIALHLELRAREFEAQGMSPEAARHAALAAFGSVDAVTAACRAEDAALERDRRRREWVRDIGVDVGYGVRTLRKNAVFTLAAVATLTLGIGAAAAVYTVVNGVLVRPLPYRDPSSLAMVWMGDTDAQGITSQLPLSTGFFADLSEQTSSFSGVAAFRFWPYTVAGDGPAEQVAGARVSPALFPVLGATPQLGRTFTAEEAQPGGPAVVVLSDAYWRRRFGGHASVIGEVVQLSGQPFTVVGVMRPGFTFPRGAELPGGFQFRPRTELWTPLVVGPNERQDYGTQNLAAVGRLAPGVTRDAAQAEISTNLQRFLDRNGVTARWSYQLVALRDQAARGVRRSLLILLGAVGFVLLIACANVANLLVARTAARSREFAIRAALGAGWSRIARQLVTENLVLAGLGTVAGLGASFWATWAMLSLVPGAMPRADDIAVDWRVVVVVGGVAALAGIIFGIGAARVLRRGTLAGALHAEGARSTGGAGRRLGRRALVAAEVSLSLVLLIGAAQLVDSFIRLQRVDPGFDPRHAVVADVQLPLARRFDPASDGPGWRRFFEQLMARLGTVPGLEAVGAVSSLPLTGAEEASSVIIPERPADRPELNPRVHYQVVSGDYFGAMGIPMLAGRGFTLDDHAAAVPVIVVNRAFVRRYFADSAVVGRTLQGNFEFGRGPIRTIVGVAGDVRQTGLDDPPTPMVYVPVSQLPYPALSVVMRTDGPAAAALAELRRAVRALNPDAAVARERPMATVLGQSLARQRFSSTIITVFASAALVLTVVGVYGVIAVTLGQRRREIGIRLALGAQQRQVTWLMLGEGGRIIMVGVVLGLAGAVVTTRVVRALLYDAGTPPAALFAGSALAIVLVSLAATWLPARRAARMDATRSLREE
jgi:predicted permease